MVTHHPKPLPPDTIDDPPPQDPDPIDDPHPIDDDTGRPADPNRAPGHGNCSLAPSS